MRSFLPSLILLLVSVCCHGEEDTCRSADIVVLSKEELKSEMNRQLLSMQAESCAIRNHSTSECDTDKLLKAINTIEENLSAKMAQQFAQQLKPVLAQLNALHRPGMSQCNPANSCKEIFDIDPTSQSGPYWLEASNGRAVRMYCDMTRSCGGITGGWMQVASLDMRKSGSECPSGLRERVHPGKRLCGKGADGGGCSQVNFNTNTIEYSRVCGKIIAYQYGSPAAFAAGVGATIEMGYLDGISLTYGRSPRKHVWSFAGASDEVGTYPSKNCPCTNIHSASGATRPPSFVGNDYFCDTGSEHRYRNDYLYSLDPLWDGAGCGPANTCCSFNNPPWFLKQLPSATRDNIEMRVCCNENINDEDIRIQQIEIYVQ